MVLLAAGRDPFLVVNEQQNARAVRAVFRVLLHGFRIGTDFVQGLVAQETGNLFRVAALAVVEESAIGELLHGPATDPAAHMSSRAKIQAF